MIALAVAPSQGQETKKPHLGPERVPVMATDTGSMKPLPGGVSELLFSAHAPIIQAVLYHDHCFFSAWSKAPEDGGIAVCKKTEEARQNKRQ